MSYELIFDENALQQLSKLPTDIKSRIFKKLQNVKEDPHFFFIKLVGRSEYKLRIGDYRVIADLIDNRLQVLVLYVDHRKRVYKRI